jgi:hypothetical protein
MKGVSFMIQILLFGALAIFALMILFFVVPGILESSENADTTTAITSKCREWGQQGCTQPAAETIEVDDMTLKELCLKHYKSTDWSSVYLKCKEMCFNCTIGTSTK